MALERTPISFTQPSRKTTFISFAIPAYLLGWWLFDLHVGGVMFALGSLLPAYFVWAILAGNAFLKAVIAACHQKGLSLDFQMDTLFIDSKKKLFAFANWEKKTLDIYSANDILTWEHSWMNHTETQSNVWGTSSHSRTSQRQNVLAIHTNNPEQPLYQISCRNHATAKVWMARLAAVING